VILQTTNRAADARLDGSTHRDGPCPHDCTDLERDTSGRDSQGNQSVFDGVSCQPRESKPFIRPCRVTRILVAEIHKTEHGDQQTTDFRPFCSMRRGAVPISFEPCGLDSTGLWLVACASPARRSRLAVIAVQLARHRPPRLRPAFASRSFRSRTALPHQHETMSGCGPQKAHASSRRWSA